MVDADRAVEGHEPLPDPLAYHHVARSPETVLADCLTRQHLVAYIQGIGVDHGLVGGAGSPAPGSSGG